MLPTPSITSPATLPAPTLSPGSIVSELLRVTDVINWMSPLSTISTLYDPGVDWEESRVRMVLERKDLSVEERAEKLMMGL